jgi:hypothetical protein
LFVTGIHPRLTEDDITRLFEKYGNVEKANIMRDPHTRESRGFGFVNMSTGQEADAAKEGLQGEIYEGRTLSIEKARRSKPRTSTPGKYFGPPKRGKSSLNLDQVLNTDTNQTTSAAAVAVATTGTMTVVEEVGMAVDTDVTVVMMDPTRVEEVVAGTDTTTVQEATVVDVATGMTATHHAAVEVAGSTAVVTTKVVAVVVVDRTELPSLLVVAGRTTTVLVAVMTTADAKRHVGASPVALKDQFRCDVSNTYQHCSLVAQVQKLLSISQSRHIRSDKKSAVKSAGGRTSDLLFQHFP